MNLNYYIQKYLFYLKSSLSTSPHTLDNYQRDLTKFLVFTNYTDDHPNDCDKRIAKQFFLYLMNKEYSKKSIARYISACRSCWDYFMQEEIVTTNPWRTIRLPKLDKTLPDFLAADSMEAFLDAIPIDTELGWRNRMICELLYATGMRVSELTAINVQDINLEKHECLVTGKGNKQRITIFVPITANYIAHYLKNIRPKWVKQNGTDAFLCNEKGTRLTQRSVQRIVKTCCEKQQINQKITPHTLRHSFATDLYNNGADLSAIQELLGHKNIVTTEIYTHVAYKKLQKVIDQANQTDYLING